MFPISFYVYAILAISAIGGFWYGHHESVVLDEYKAKIEFLGKQAEQHNQEIIEQQKAETKKVENEYKTKLNSITTYYDRMRQSSSGSMPSTSSTITFADGTTKDFISVAQDCAATTQQLISLQEWVASQSKIK